MLAQMRHREILNHLKNSGGTRVAALARAMRVTEETIRRDLQKLEKEGRLVRTHGGALPVLDARYDPPFNERRTARLDAKRRIASSALTHIAENDIIAVDASSTAFELIRRLPDIPLTVITNALPAAAALQDYTRVRVISTGGVLDQRSMSLVGSLAEDALDRFNINKVFLSAKGVDIARGLSESVEEHARIKRRMAEIAERVILLSDHSKFGLRSTIFFADLSAIDLVITDSDTHSEFLEALRERDTPVEIAT